MIKMAYRMGNREQIMMFPPKLEDFVPEDDPARVYDAFVESLDFSKLDFKMNHNKVGNPEYDPKSMLKVILYGYSYGERSSRKLERAVNHNTIFMWLAGGLKPDHITIARFRKRNKKLLKKVFKQCAKLCIELKLIAGNTLFTDGSKMRANAGIKSTYTKEQIENYLQGLDKRINTILNECAKADKQEENMGSFVKLTEELNNVKKIKAKVETVMAEMKEEDQKEVNTTDSDCKKMKGRQGTHTGYNAQIVVDEKHGLIVSNDVVNDANDLNQFSNQINQANEMLDVPCQTACADAGYSKISDLKEIDDQEITVVVPTQKQTAHNSKEKLFEKEKFIYQKDLDCYICPAGNELSRHNYDKTKNAIKYRIKNARICRKCQNFGICTKSSSYGRSIDRSVNEELKAKLEKIYVSAQGQRVYQKRKEKVELPFGHIKHNLRCGAFLLRGLDGVRAEMNVLSTVFNIRRMISLLGSKRLIEAIAMVRAYSELKTNEFLLIIEIFLNGLFKAISKCIYGFQLKTAYVSTLGMTN